jgi:hypothetical protein
MAQTRKVSRNNTTVVKSSDCIRVTLHSTEVFVKRGNEVTLNNGGYISVTTQARMNQCACEFCDGAFSVSRAGGQMVVHKRNGEKIPFQFSDVTFTL